MNLQRYLPGRLDWQVMLLSSILLGVTMFTFAMHEAAEDAERVIESAKRQAKALARNIAVTSVEDLVTQDFASTEQLLLRAAHFPGVLDIQILNMDGNVLGDVINKPDAEPRISYEKRSVKAPLETIEQLTEQGGKLMVWEPIDSTLPVGWVRLTYSLAEAENIKKARMLNYFIDGIVVTIALILLILLLMRHPLKVLRDAATFARRLQDKSGEQIPLDSQTIEIKQLGEALNQASKSLFEQQTLIEKALADLKTQKSAMDEHSIVSITDVEGKISYANQKFLQVTGFSCSELRGSDFRILNSGHHDKKFFEDLWATISSGQVWHGEMLNEGKFGRKVWLNTTIVPFMDDQGKPYEYVAISTDVSQQKSAEQQLEFKNRSLEVMTNHLEDMVKKRTAELEQANQELLKLNQVKSEFVSIVSHELRTPLTSIKSFAEILKDDLEEMDISTQKHYLMIINNESDRLGRLINDLLDLQKMDSGKTIWHDENADLAELTKASVDFFSKSFNEKGLELRFEILEGNFPVHLDTDRIRQVIENLLSNALKFTETGEVIITIRETVRTLHVLLVNDDEETLDHLTRQLKAFDLTVTSFTDGTQALKLLQKRNHGIDLVITDINIPGMNGVDLLKGIRSFLPKFPVLLMSGISDEKELKRMLKYQATGFIEKPLSEKDVIPIIEKTLGKKLEPGYSKNMVELSVYDNGPGIPEEETSKIFERFHQVDSSETREKGGSGLGLAICKEIIEHYQGKIWVQSEEGKGSRFVFTLPQEGSKKKLLGEILVESGLVSQQQIDHALANQH